jgi:hypothetical protein
MPSFASTIRRLATVSGLVAIVVAACAGAVPSGSGDVLGETATPGSPSAVPSDGGSMSASPSADASSAASGSPTTGGDLAAAIPDMVGDVRLTKTTLDGAAFSAMSPDTRLDELVGAVDATLDDVQVVIALGGTETAFLSVTAIQVAGADAEALETAVTEQLNARAGGQTVVEQTELGGKPVTSVNDPTESIGVLYAWVSGDTLLTVQSRDEALATEAIRALP